MTPFSAIDDIRKALLYPFRMIFVAGLCFLINYLTSPGHGWFQWVAFGMGIGLLVAWVRALWGVGFAALTAGIACLVYRWLQRHQVAPAVKA